MNLFGDEFATEDAEEEKTGTRMHRIHTDEIKMLFSAYDLQVYRPNTPPVYK